MVTFIYLLGWKLSPVAFCNVIKRKNTTELSFQPNISDYWFPILALIHDDSIDLRLPKEPIDLWINLIIDNLKYECPNPSVANAIYVGPTASPNKALTRYQSNCKSNTG